MHSQLTPTEIFKLLQSRYHDFCDSGGFDPRGSVYDAKAHNAVVAVLKDFTESFSQGRLKIVAQ